MAKKLKSLSFYKAKGYQRLVSLRTELESMERDFNWGYDIFISGKTLLDDRQEFMIYQRDISLFRNMFYRTFANIPLKDILLQLWYIN